MTVVFMRIGLTWHSQALPRALSDIGSISGGARSVLGAANVRPMKVAILLMYALSAVSGWVMLALDLSLPTARLTILVADTGVIITIQTDHNPFFILVYGIGKHTDWTNVPIEQ